MGGPGTAKTATIHQFLGRFSKEEHSSKTVNFSYLTTPGIFQQAIEVRREGEVRLGGVGYAWGLPLCGLGRCSLVRSIRTAVATPFADHSWPCSLPDPPQGTVEKRQGRTYGPPSGKTLTVFIDDISMPAINDWGDQVGAAMGCACARLSNVLVRVSAIHQ